MPTAPSATPTTARRTSATRSPTPSRTPTAGGPPPARSPSPSPRSTPATPWGGKTRSPPPRAAPPTGTVTITTPPVNDSDPGAVNDTITLAEGATATTLSGGQASVLWNDTDADLPAHTLSVALASGPRLGLPPRNSD